MSDTALAPVEYMILTIRGHRVMLDADLAALYGVPTKVLNQAVKRNADRFPVDFMFRLTPAEWADLRSQIVTAKDDLNLDGEVLRSQSGESAPPIFSASVSGKRRTPPLAFTQEGVSMLSSVLNSPRAIQTNIEIMRAFVRLRTDVLSYAELAKRLDSLEARYDDTFAVVFDALRDLMTQPPVEEKERRMGFRVKERRTRYEASLR